MTKEKTEKAFKKYQTRKAENIKSGKRIKLKHFRIVIRPFLRLLLLLQRKLKGQHTKVMGNYKYSLSKDTPVVFVMSHIGKYDFEIVNELISEQFYTLASDYRNMHGNFNGFMMNLFGCVFVNEISKLDRRNSKLMLIKILRSKAFHKPLNVFICPEGTWNLSENEIIYDISFGTVEIALSGNAVILPIGVEQYNNKFIVNFGEIYDPTLTAKQFTEKSFCEITDEKLLFKIKGETARELRDHLATLKYEIWESEGLSKREDIPADYWKGFINDRLGEWQGYSMQEQIDSVFHPKCKTEQKEIEFDLNNIKPNLNNIFLFKRRNVL